MLEAQVQNMKIRDQMHKADTFDEVMLQQEMKVQKLRDALAKEVINTEEVSMIIDELEVSTKMGGQAHALQKNFAAAEESVAPGLHQFMMSQVA